MESLALEALQMAAEEYLIKLMEQGGLCAAHAKRKTMHEEDLYLARRIRGDINEGAWNEPGRFVTLSS
jgi:histone H3/H4